MTAVSADGNGFVSAKDLDICPEADQHLHHGENMMQHKTVASQLVLFRRECLTIPQVAGFADRHCAAIRDEAARCGLAVAGPWIFVSHGLPDNPDQQYWVDFCLPVAPPLDASLADGAALKELEAFSCISETYKGKLADLFAAGYAPLLREAARAGEQLSGQSREVYWRWLGADSPDNCVEIQFGLSRR
ncbi:hypothetical protein [Crenobacter luteus]|uniref:hypothetical protein n=1 Tax=Crenobacter luteus TaxID=1452487 RepID=UPI0012E88290|nr:hypothetical protein [Crenobacter luteus]